MKKIITPLLIVSIFFLFTCSIQGLKKYSPRSNYPKAVFIENQVGTIKTNKVIPRKNYIYVDITKRDSKKKSGRLIQISEDTVWFSSGYHYVGKNDSLKVVEKIVTVRKKDILMMKIW